MPFAIAPCAVLAGSSPVAFARRAARVYCGRWALSARRRYQKGWCKVRHLAPPLHLPRLSESISRSARGLHRLALFGARSKPLADLALSEEPQKSLGKCNVGAT